MTKKKIFQSDVKNHISPLVDCRTLAVTNILNADNMSLDSEIVFALCGGLDIWACKTSEHSKICIFITRNMSTEISFLKRLGYDVDIQDNLPNDRLAELLENGSRIIIDVDRFYLPNYVEAFGAQHFGFHCSNIIGFEVFDTNERVFCAYEFLRDELYISR